MNPLNLVIWVNRFMIRCENQHVDPNKNRLKNNVVLTYLLSDGGIQDVCTGVNFQAAVMRASNRQKIYKERGQAGIEADK